MLDLQDHILRKAYQLSLNEYAVLIETYYLSHNNKFGGWCVKSRQNMADTLDLTKDTIQRAINVLESKKLIEKNPDTKFIRTSDRFNSVLAERNSYAFSVKTEHEDLQTMSSMENHTVAAKSVRGVTENQSGVAAKSVTNIYIKDNILNKTPIVPKGQWEEFWSKYPKRVKKQNSIRAWNRLSDEERSAALRALDSFLISPDWIKDEGRYIPHPTSWINGKRWEDTPTPIPSIPFPKTKEPKPMSLEEQLVYFNNLKPPTP